MLNPNTLNQHMHKLNAGERAIICRAMRKYGGFPDAHNGMLPFFSMSKITVAMAMERVDDPLSRTKAALWNKLMLNNFEPAKTPLVMFLDPVKVYKRFGHHPERGVSIPGTTKVKRAAGLSWNLGKKDYVPHEITVPTLVSLHRIATTKRWLVYANDNDRDRKLAALYLEDHCNIW